MEPFGQTLATNERPMITQYAINENLVRYVDGNGKEKLVPLRDHLSNGEATSGLTYAPYRRPVIQDETAEYHRRTYNALLKKK